MLKDIVCASQFFLYEETKRIRREMSCTDAMVLRQCCKNQLNNSLKEAETKLKDIPAGVSPLLPLFFSPDGFTHNIYSTV